MDAKRYIIVNPTIGGLPAGPYEKSNYLEFDEGAVVEIVEHDADPNLPGQVLVKIAGTDDDALDQWIDETSLKEL